MRSAASGVAQAFRRAQSLAVSEQKNFIVVVRPKRQNAAPRFCWDPPTTTTLFAIVEDVEGDCKIGKTSAAIDDCSPQDVRFRGWGGNLPRGVGFVAQPVSAEAIDIGGSPGGDRFRTLCFTPRGYVSRQTPVGNGVQVGIATRSVNRRVQVAAAGRVKLQRYQGGQWFD